MHGARSQRKVADSVDSLNLDRPSCVSGIMRNSLKSQFLWPSCSQSELFQNVNVMIQSFPQSALADIKAGQTTTRFRNRRFRSRGSFIRATSTDEDSRSLINSHRCRAPHFLTSRLGLSWTQILADLRSVARSEAEYCQMLHALAAFVETSVTGSSDGPRHGTGLLVGQPLTAGWRRRLYVCPGSDRLLPITNPSVLESRR